MGKSPRWEKSECRKVAGESAMAWEENREGEAVEWVDGTTQGRRFGNYGERGAISRGEDEGDLRGPRRESWGRGKGGFAVGKGVWGEEAVEERGA